MVNSTGLFGFAPNNQLASDEEPTSGSILGCDNTTYDLKNWVLFSLIPAFSIIILFSFLQPRVRLWPKCCYQRPSLAFPANLIDSYQDRVSFACGFAVMSTSMILLFTGEWFFSPDISHIPSMLQGTVLIMIAMCNVLTVSVVYYPILLCLSADDQVVGNVIGLIYTGVWSFYYIAVLTACPKDSGVQGKTVTAALGPVYLCYLALEVRFAYGLFKNIRDALCRSNMENVMDQGKVVDEDVAFKQTHYYKRVEYLFRPPEIEKNVSFTVRLRRKFIQDAPGFKFSRRSICTFVLSALTTYQLGLLYVIGMSELWSSANATLAIGGPVFNLFEMVNETDIFYDIKTFFQIAEDTFWPTCYVAIGTTVMYSLHMQICYRKHTLRLWRGNKDFCPKGNTNFASLVVASLRYSGYHIGFATWGFLILQIISWILVFFVVYFIIRPLQEGEDTPLINFLKDYWLTLVVGMVLYYAQVLLSHVAFLQSDKEDNKTTTYLSLNNRRAFNITVYITLFMNVLLGLASCLLRILKAVIFGVLFIGRIDRCVLMRGWELWDTGFRAYIGFLQLEVSHTHPVVVTFCYLLRKSIAKPTYVAQLPSYKTFDSIEDGPIEKSPVNESPASAVKSRRALNRWFVALTLMRNRALVMDRVGVLPELQRVRAESREAAGRNSSSAVKHLNALLRRSCDGGEYERMTDEEGEDLDELATSSQDSSLKETDWLLHRVSEQFPEETRPGGLGTQPVITNKVSFKNPKVIMMIPLVDNEISHVDKDEMRRASSPDIRPASSSDPDDQGATPHGDGPGRSMSADAMNNSTGPSKHHSVEKASPMNSSPIEQLEEGKIVSLITEEENAPNDSPSSSNSDVCVNEGPGQLARGGVGDSGVPPRPDEPPGDPVLSADHNASLSLSISTSDLPDAPATEDVSLSPDAGQTNPDMVALNIDDSYIPLALDTDL